MPPPVPRGRSSPKEQFVFVHDVRHSEVNGSEDQDEGLNDTVEKSDDENKDSLWVNDSVVDHGWGIELGIV